MPKRLRFPWPDAELQQRVEAAVRDYWRRRGGQSTRQKAAGVTDTGTPRRGDRRSAPERVL